MTEAKNETKLTLEDIEAWPNVGYDIIGSRRAYNIVRWIHGPDDAGRFWKAVAYVHEDEGISDDFGVDIDQVQRVTVTREVWGDMNGNPLD